MSGRRLSVAFWSPLPPQRSGIADYSAELLPHLARHVHVELIVDPGVRPAPELAAAFPVRSGRELPGLLAAGRYDVVLYQLGNNRDYHAGMYRALLEHPGVVVLHELVLHHLVRDLTLFSGDPEGYAEELRYAYGASGLAMARRCLATAIPLDPFSHPLFERVVDRSLAVIVHNEYTRQRVLASRPLARVVKVPHHLSLGDVDPALSEGPREASGRPKAAHEDASGGASDRAALGLPEDAFVVASFGFFTAAKRLDVSLRAFARLRREVPRALYLLVGEVSPHYDFASVFTPELRDGVLLVGRTELDRFLSYMRATDVAVNLRHPTGGETSGTLIRLLGLGTPVVVSRAGAFAELPDDCCAKVDVDDREEELLLAYLRRLAADEPLRRRLGENARAHVAAHHTLEGSARAYADLLAEVAASGARPRRPVPPLAPYPPEDVLSALLAEVTAEVADLGIGEEDEEALRGVAEAVVDLDLDLKSEVS